MVDVGFYQASHYYGESAAITSNVIRVAASCSCGPPSPGFACMARRHATPDDRAWAAALRRFERRAQFRDFVGRAGGPTVVVSHPQHSRRDERAERRRMHAWRTRALGKRPLPSASG